MPPRTQTNSYTWRRRAYLGMCAAAGGTHLFDCCFFTLPTSMASSVESTPTLPPQKEATMGSTCTEHRNRLAGVRSIILFCHHAMISQWKQRAPAEHIRSCYNQVWNQCNSHKKNLTSTTSHSVMPQEGLFGQCHQTTMSARRTHSYSSLGCAAALKKLSTLNEVSQVSRRAQYQ